jgi:hypothetical protein
MTLTELENVKPGRSVGHIRHGGGQLIDTDITRGVVPESSNFAANDAEIYVATDSLGHADVAIGLEHIHDGEADLGIETFDGKTLDPSFAQKLVIEAMHQSGVRLASLDPNMAAITEEALPQVGFQPDPAGENYTLSLAA